MIDKLTLHNFQSHKNSELKFHNRINSMVGISDSGKSSIVRALYQARYNQGAIDPFVSKWTRDKKGNQKEQMNIIIKKNDNILIRGKGKELNGYKLNDSTFEALGKSGLPEEVSNFFNTTEVNIQKQMDVPFLIGNKPSEIATFLNTIIDMSDIDLFLSAIDSKKRTVNKDIRRIQNELTITKRSKDSFHSLDDINRFIGRLELLENKHQIKSTSITDLKQTIEDYSNYSTKVRSVGNIDVIKANLTTIEDIENKLSSINIKKNNLSELIYSYNEQNIILEISIDTATIKKQLSEIEKTELKINNIEIEIKELKKLKEDYINNKNYLEISITKIKELKNKLPDICPTCGQKWVSK